MKEFIDEYGSICVGAIVTIIITGIVSALYFSGAFADLVMGVLGRAV